MRLARNDQMIQQVSNVVYVQEQQKLYNKKYAFFIQHNEKYVQIVCELPNIFTVEDTIRFVLQQFNQEIGTCHQLQKGNDYVLKISKKSGEPKDDLPSLDFEQILVETGCQTFTVVCKVNNKMPEQQQTSVTTTMCSQQDASIKSRVSYTNALNKGKKPIKEGSDKEKSGGFCFFKKCF